MKKAGLWILGFPKRAYQIIACALICTLVFLVFTFLSILCSSGWPPAVAFHLQTFAPELFWQLSSFISDAVAYLSAIERGNHLASAFAGLICPIFTHRAYLAIIAALVFSGCTCCCIILDKWMCGLTCRPC